MNSNRQLTQKQSRFISDYLVDLNAKQAAIRAGYGRKTARTIAADLLAKPSIQMALQEAQNDLARRTGVTQEMVIEELKKIAFSRLGDFLEQGPEGIILKSSALDADRSAPVADISTRGTDGGMRVKLHDKLRALELLGKYLGMFNNTASVMVGPNFVFGEQTSPDDGCIEIK